MIFASIVSINTCDPLIQKNHSNFTWTRILKAAYQNFYGPVRREMSCFNTTFDTLQGFCPWLAYFNFLTRAALLQKSQQQDARETSCRLYTAYKFKNLIEVRAWFCSTSNYRGKVLSSPFRSHIMTACVAQEFIFGWSFTRELSKCSSSATTSRELQHSKKWNIENLVHFTHTHRFRTTATRGLSIVYTWKCVVFSWMS